MKWLLTVVVCLMLTIGLGCYEEYGDKGIRVTVAQDVAKDYLSLMLTYIFFVLLWIAFFLASWRKGQGTMKAILYVGSILFLLFLCLVFFDMCTRFPA